MTPYKRLAVFLTNTLLIATVLETFCWVVLKISEPFSRNTVVEEKYDKRLLQLFPDMNEKEIRALLHETWESGWEYEPFTEFREARRQGHYVTVDANGFRHSTNQGPWPPPKEAFVVFLFGGSTAFNYGVRDNDTIASGIARRLSQKHRQTAVYMYNFGRAYYYSSQERILFEKLVLAGLQPDIAVFLDGMNDSFFADNITGFSPLFRPFVSGDWQKTRFLINTLLHRTAIARCLQKVFQRPPQDPVSLTTSASQDDSPQMIDHIIDRYLVNKTIIERICGAYRIQPLFIWQPAPNYEYDRHYHWFMPVHPVAFQRLPAVYNRMKERRTRLSLGNHFLWLADIQRSLNKPLYVDFNHYSPDFSQLLADRISSSIMEHLR